MSIPFTFKDPGVRKSLNEYGRGLAGGLIFSLPLLFTMEVWWAAFTLNPLHLLAYVVVTFVLLLLYNRFAGMRSNSSFLEVIIDSIEELGLGLVTATVILFLVGELQSDMEILELVGKVVMEGMTMAIGFSVGTAQLGDSDEECGLANEETNSFRSQMAIALCGGVLFVSSVAPTEEILVIATQVPFSRLLVLSLFSLLLGGYVVHFVEFRGSSIRSSVSSNFELVRNVICTYAIALFAAAGTLYFFGRFEGEAPITNVQQTIVAGFPAVLGASAGRLLLQTGGNNQSQSKDEDQ